MNYDKISSIANLLEDYAKMLKSSARNGVINDEATDGIARQIRKLNNLGVTIEELED